MTAAARDVKDGSGKDRKDEKPIVITGGCGFIGLNLLYHLASKGRYRRYVIVDNLSVGRVADVESALGELGTWNVEAGPARGKPAADCRWYRLERPGKGGPHICSVELHRHDIRNAQGLAEILAGSSAVVHLAAQTGVIPSLENPVQDMEQNVGGTLNVLEACRITGTPRFVFASSSAPLGEQEPPIDESKVPRPLSPYGASKLAGEGYCSAYAGSFGLETVALRFSNVYGPRSTYKGSVVATFVKNILSDTPLTIYGSGGQTRDFIYVEDLCDAIDRALSVSDPKAFGSVFQIATFRETTVNELAERLKTIAEKAGLGPVRILYEAERTGEIKRSFSDISRAEGLLGYRPVYDLDKGLTKTWEWFLARRDTFLP
jgi:UDP-glucose 4-epimerase